MKQPDQRQRAAGRRIAGHAQEDHILDPYQARQKPAEGAVCPECGALYWDGRWQWPVAARNAAQQICPACRRISDKFPAGVVTLRGRLPQPQQDDLVRLVRHQEEAEKAEHPLNRIIGIDETAQGLVVTTTDIHLPPRIGEVVRRAFHGALDIEFDSDEYFVRVNWTLPSGEAG